MNATSLLAAERTRYRYELRDGLVELEKGGARQTDYRRLAILVRIIRILPLPPSLPPLLLVVVFVVSLWID